MPTCRHFLCTDAIKGIDIHKPSYSKNPFNSFDDIVHKTTEWRVALFVVTTIFIGSLFA